MGVVKGTGSRSELGTLREGNSDILVLDSNMHGNALCPCCHIPSQSCPSVFSVYPVSHEQVYEPIALLQVC